MKDAEMNSDKHLMWI